MQNQEVDFFSVFKRTRPEENDKDITNTQQIKKKVRIDQPKVDPMNLLQTNLIKETIFQVPDIAPEQSEDEANKNRLEDFELQIIRTEQGCIHEVYVPKGYKRTQYIGNYTAKTYPFKLDPFQKKSVHAIQSDQSVLVCAHTSAGKTAIAQYSIAVSLKRNSRVIYTSPIKALSNQKYRQLKQQFKDVGLITGDVTIDPQSTCLVMTTEILRSMIYKGSQVVREVKWVIFDQVHYMRDKQRGVVWQETIIMLPPNVRFVFLSATIGNPGQFAHWITKLKKQPCNVVYTDYRPIPLEHYLCPSGSEAIYLVVDDKGKFLQDNFNRAIEKLGDNVDVIGINKKNKKKMSKGSDLSKIVKLIMQKHFDPVIIFSFSKKDVEAYALSMVKYDFTTKEEKQKITEIFTNAINVLGDEDRKLPQIISILAILEKGIGIHHGGLLPLIKEVIQILFQEGLLKCLFSTETFSMGLNMPARTVVFTSVRKFDGEQFRWMGGGEYIQMSGRAGRRGLDKKGITILMIDQKMEPEVAKSMLKGQSDNLLSSFYINYNMMLNSQRLEDIDPEYIIRRSFLQFQSDMKVPKLIQEYNQKKLKYQQIKVENEKEVQRLYYIVQRINDYKQLVRKIVMRPKIALGYLSVGRIVRIKHNNVDWGYGVSINFHQRKEKIKKNNKKDKDIVDDQAEPLYLVDIMVYIKPRKNNELPVPCPFSEPGELTVMTFTLSSIFEITTLKISNLPSDLSLSSSKSLVLKTLIKLLQKDIPILNISSSDPKLIETYKLLKKVEQQRTLLKKYEPSLQLYTRKKQIYNQIKEATKIINQSSGMVLKSQMKALSRVLKRTQMIEKGVVTIKGNVGCEISSNHEILLTHLLFDGFFTGMQPNEIAALLSSLVHDEKSNTDKKFVKSEKLHKKLEQLTTHAKYIYQIFSQCKVKIQEEQYLASIKQQLVEVTLAWCNGASFQEICKMTDSFEGSIIRTLRRLDQLLKQMTAAAKVIGNEELQKQFRQASQNLKRGIVFAASLYL